MTFLLAAHNMCRKGATMKITKSDFGITNTGENIHLYHLENNSGAYVEVIDFGCRLVKIVVPDRDGNMRDVCLGLDTMDGYEKIAEENRVNIEEIKSMKNSIIESNAHYDKVIDELNKKINTISTELVEARKRTSVLRSSQCYSSRDMNSVVRYANEIEELKNELEEEKKKHYNEMKKAEEDIAKIKMQLAEDTFKKDDEIIKLKNTNKKYYTILVDKGLIKK